MTLEQPFSVIANDNVQSTPRAPRLRFAPIVNLRNGERFGADVQVDVNYEEQCMFGFGAAPSDASPARWLGDLIEKAARQATMMGLTERPLAILAPLAALTDPDAPMAAEAGARRANVCPQEIRLEFSDAALAAEEDLGVHYLEAFHKRGFRIGIDARSGWRTPFGAMARLLVEAVRLDAQRLDPLDVPETRLDAACGDGVVLFAENAGWRDADNLAGIGVDYAISPRTDA